MHLLKTTLLLMFVASVTSLMANDAMQVSMTLTEKESDLLAKTNEFRARYGKAPLKMSIRLMESARRHASWMASSGSLTHTSDPVAENIAWGQSSVDEAITSWMNSPGHRANMLSNEFTELGVAAYVVEGGRIYWCQQFVQ